jgi:hypothetical protein
MREKIGRGIRILIIGSITPAMASITSPISLMAQTYAPPPMRLGVKAAQTTLAIGAQGRFWITFLDRKYQTTASDTKRVIELKLDISTSTGSIEIPPSVEAFPGQKEVPVVFTAQKPGRILIRASSKGLDSGSVLFTVTAAKKSAVSFLPTAWAQDAPQVGFFALADQVPANGTSVARFQVTLDPSSATQTEVQINADPPCTLLYAGANRRHSNHSITIVIPPQEQTSLELQARTSQPGNVPISAKILPQGPPSETMLTFVKPQAASLAFEELPLSIPLSGGVRLRIHVADQDAIFVKPLSGSWNVTAKPAGNADMIQLDPDQVVLSGAVPMREVTLKVTGMPLSEELLIYASTENGALRTAEKKLGFESHVGNLRVLVPREVNAGAPVDVKALFLLKGQEREAATEFPRRVRFFSDDGSFDPMELTVERGATYASSKFVGRKPGHAKLYISTFGVDSKADDPVIVLIVMALSQLVPIAFASGMIGGLARFFYYHEQLWNVWPQKTSNGWNPGVVGNAVFCGVFGVVLLLMAQAGLVQSLLNVELVYSSSGAFLLGITGGFIGVVLLEVLAERLGLADALARRQQRTRGGRSRSPVARR